MRKFNEILLAIEIERALDKREIFELYFNRVFRVIEPTASRRRHRSITAKALPISISPSTRCWRGF